MLAHIIFEKHHLKAVVKKARPGEADLKKHSVILING
jgi:hypothetical protein